MGPLWHMICIEHKHFPGFWNRMIETLGYESSKIVHHFFDEKYKLTIDFLYHSVRWLHERTVRILGSWVSVIKQLIMKEDKLCLFLWIAR